MIKEFRKSFFELCQKNQNNEAVLLDYGGNLLSLSYTDLFKLITQTYYQVADHQRILSLLPNSLQKAVYFLCSSYYGKQFSPMQCHITERELKRVISLFKPDVCLISEALLDPSIVQMLKDNGIQIINVQEDINLYLESINSLKAVTIAPSPNQNANLYLYTSGTTGESKLLVLSLDKLWSSAENFSKIYQLDQVSHLRFWNYLPMSYLGGLFNLCLIPLAAGGSFFIDEPFSGKTFLNFWNQINRLKINLIWFVPSIIKGLLKLFNDREPQAINHVIEKCFLGTAPISLVEKQRFEEKFSLELCENYGLSETTFISAEMNIKDRSSRHENFVGRVVPEIYTKTLSSGDLEIESNEKNIGEIYVKTPFLFEGYLTKEGLQKPILDMDGYFNTQDIGLINKDNKLYLYGRNRDIIKRGGLLIFLAEIDSILMESGLADEYVAVACDHPFYGESYNLFVKSNSPSPTLKKSIQGWTQKNLSKNKWPEDIIIVDNIPKTSNGKVQRQLLKESM